MKQIGIDVIDRYWRVNLALSITLYDLMIDDDLLLFIEELSWITDTDNDGRYQW